MVLSLISGLMLGVALLHLIPHAFANGQSDYQHATVPRIGVLLTNLGTPEAPTDPTLLTGRWNRVCPGLAGARALSF